MTRQTLILLFLGGGLAALFDAGAQTSSSPEQVPVDPFAVICPITEMVDDGMAVLVERAVKEAKGAAVLVFEIDTPGGRVDSAIEITKDIVDAPCKTVAYIKGQGAISAGALIAYACDEIVMAPATSIGASAPVLATGGDPSETMDQKTKSFLRSRYRALAEEQNHNPLLAEAMVDPNIELRGRKLPDGTYEIYEHNPEERGRSDAAGVVESVRDTMRGPTGELVRDLLREVTGVPIPESPPPLEKNASEEGTERTEPEGEAETAADDSNVERFDDGSELICARGELLTLTSKEAQRYGLIPGTAPNLDSALAYAHDGALTKRPIVPKWDETLYRWLTSPMIAGFLLLIGIGGIYVEFKTPGVWLPGVVGVIALAIFFGAHLVIGLADWFDLFLVAAGLMLLAAEIFVIPGFTLAGIGGFLCLFVGLYMSLTRVTLPQYSWEFARLQDAAQTLTTTSVLFVLLVVLTWKLFPSSPFANWLILRHAQQDTAGYVVQTDAQVQAAVGLCGISLSVLRPAGRGHFGDVTYDIVTRGEFVESGRPIVIVEAEGNRYVVAEDRQAGSRG